jgi:hypothetical protein
MIAKRFAVALLVLLLAAADAAAVVTQTPYQINGGGAYRYKPSGMGPGIPGGMPSDYQLDFGIGGTFVYELDSAGPTARLLSLNLSLTGNEAIQAAPPPSPFIPVTADRVEAWLGGHVFVNDFIGGLLHLESSTVDGLKLTDTLSGSLFLRGGYDATPVDGDGMHFEFTAVAVPEPAAAMLLVMSGLAVLRRRR